MGFGSGLPTPELPQTKIEEVQFADAGYQGKYLAHVPAIGTAAIYQSSCIAEVEPHILKNRGKCDAQSDTHFEL